MAALAVVPTTSILDEPFDTVFDRWEQMTRRGSDLKMSRALCMWDRYFLLVQIFGRHDVLHPWMYDRCREVERNPDGYIDLWARDHRKSTIITYAGVIQEVLRDPEITIGIFSHTAPIAKAFLKQIRTELERNEKLKLLFPDVIWSNPSKEAPSWSLDGGITLKRKTNPKEATIEAHGLVDGQPTSKHFKLLVYDDVVVKESVSTPEQVAKTTEAWELSDNLGMQGSRKWHIGTRWSFADSYDAIIKKGSVIPRIHAATHDGTMSGRPVFLSVEANDKKKIDQGDYVYSCQMLQNPLSGHQRMFNVEDLQVYEIRPATLNVYIMIDPARSKKKDSDNTAMVVLGLDYAGNKYLLDGFNHKMDLKERWQSMFFLYRKWSVEPGVRYLKVGYETFGAQADMDYFLEQMKLPGMKRFSITELAWPREGSGAKEDRVQRLGPDIRSHKLFLPYMTDEKSLTSNQRMMTSQGYDYRISTPIKRVDENKKMYDLSVQMREQIHYFPYGALKDLVDAASRIYDMEPLPPRGMEPNYAEPEYV